MEDYQPQDANMMSRIARDFQTKSENDSAEKLRSIRESESVKDKIEPIILENLKNVVTKARKGKNRAKIFHLEEKETCCCLPCLFCCHICTDEDNFDPRSSYSYKKVFDYHDIEEIKSLIEEIAGEIDKKHNLGYRYKWKRGDPALSLTTLRYHYLYAKWN